MRVFANGKFMGARLAGLAFLFAMAAVPLVHAANYVGWVLGNQPDATAPYTPEPQYSFNSLNQTNEIEPQGKGLYYVYLSVINFGAANGAPDDVQVSAYNTSGWCVLQGWGGAPGGRGTVQVKVQCFDAQGAPADAAFTVVYQSRGGSFGTASKGVDYLQADQPSNTNLYAPSIYQSFDSTGGSNTAKTNKTGNYTMTLPGLTKLGGNVQVTPLYVRSRCKPVSWGVVSAGTTVNVQCYGDGVPYASEFTLAYSVGEPLGVMPGAGTQSAWAFANEETSTNAYTPILTQQYNGFGTGHLTAQKTGAGLYTVTIPGTLSYSTSVALVTAVGNNSAYCNLAGWTASAINVACYANGGVPSDSRFEVSFETAK